MQSFCVSMSKIVAFHHSMRSGYAILIQTTLVRPDNQFKPPRRFKLHLDLTVKLRTELNKESSDEPLGVDSLCILTFAVASVQLHLELQKGVVPAAPSGTATLLRLSPNYQVRPRPILAVTDFRRPRLSWLDGRCVQGPGTYSPRHG